MLKRFFTRFHRTLILAVLAVALVATGFAHRAPSTTDTALTMVLLAGGSIEDICGDSGPGTTMGQIDCLACLVTAAADLTPGQGELRDIDLVLLALVTVPPAGPAVPSLPDPAHTARGPPTA